MKDFLRVRRRLLPLLFLATFAGVVPARAQQAPAQVQPQPAPEDSVRRGIKPGTAFLRSVLVPGWGQFSAGAKTRGMLFIALQGSSYFMLGKTLSKLNDANDVRDERVAVVSDSLREQMAADTMLARILSDPVKFNAEVDSAATIVNIDKLIESRKEQRQDWIAYTIFFTLASGVDAFVAAHLADFPATITTRPAPAGGMHIRVEVPFPGRQ
jgi:hypothetical protein